MLTDEELMDIRNRAKLNDNQQIDPLPFARDAIKAALAKALAQQDPIGKICKSAECGGVDFYFDIIPDGETMLYAGPTQIPKQEPSDQELMQLGMDQPWPMLMCVKKLIECTDILLNEKGFDRTGHEYMSEAMRQAKNYIATWRPQPAQAAAIPTGWGDEWKNNVMQLWTLGRKYQCTIPDDQLDFMRDMLLSVSTKPE